MMYVSPFFLLTVTAGRTSGTDGLHAPDRDLLAVNHEICLHHKPDFSGLSLADEIDPARTGDDVAEDHGRRRGE